MSTNLLPTVYLETSVISYLTSRPSRDLIVAGRQQVTHRLWEEYRNNYHFVTSRLVEKEAAAGNQNEAKKRLEIIDATEQLKASREAQLLARIIVQESNLPPRALDDANHVAIAAVNGIEFLATWNLRHLANAMIRRKIEETCRRSGYATPLICTPDQLVGSEGAEDENNT